MRLKPGTRVWHRSQRFATIERFISPHNGYRVRFDERRQFEPETCVVKGSDITPTDPAAHAAYEEAWPVFEKPHRRKWNQFPQE